MENLLIEKGGKSARLFGPTHLLNLLKIRTLLVYLALLFYLASESTVKKDKCLLIANYFLLITGCTSFAQYRVTCSACGIRSISKDVRTLLYDFNCFVTSKKRMASACKHLSSWSGTTFNFEEAFLRSLADKCLGTIHILRKHF